ncbi:MAG TPA: hypothetical protein DCZ92_10110 [Elusimicrobia bacterium]|nr:MAG: hypothetical protein A2016_07435 [Elusimicrobia bacterium GWF2_62_30]HBA61153.1 hypothetical protein [Elusimicrobiota bacterium]
MPGAGAAKAETAGGKAPGAGIFWVSALLLIVIGYLSLVKADAGGKNAWAILSPACLLTGYLLIIPAISRSFRK